MTKQTNLKLNFSMIDGILPIDLYLPNENAGLFYSLILKKGTTKIEDIKPDEQLGFCFQGGTNFTVYLTKGPGCSS